MELNAKTTTSTKPSTVPNPINNPEIKTNPTPTSTPTTEDEELELEKYNSILNFLKKYELGASKKKLKDLMTYTPLNLEGYKMNIIIANCCKVSNRVYICIY